MQPELRAVLDAADGQGRRDALREAVVVHGLGAWEAFSDVDDDLAREALGLLEAWFSGARLTDRADEPDRRLRAAEQARAERGESVPEFDRWYAEAVLALPPGHERRDVAGAVAVLEAHLTAVRMRDDSSEAVLTIAALLDTDDGSEDLLDEGLDRLDEADDDAVDAFQLAGESYASRRHLAARDAGDESEAERWQERKAAFLSEGEDLSSLASQAAMFDSQDRWAEAAELYGRVVAGSDLARDVVQPLAIREGELRLLTGDLARAIEVLEAVAPHAQARYLTAVRDEDRAEARDYLGQCCDLLAACRARADDWSGALEALDRPRGLLSRYLHALRLTREGRDLLALQRQIDAATRGVGVQQGGADEGLPEQVELLERYRRVRPQLDPQLLTSPDLADVGAALEPHELVLSIGVHHTGSLLIGVAPGDVDEPSGRLLREDLDVNGWLEILAAGGGDWVVAPAGQTGSETEPGLEASIHETDAAVGSWLRDLLDRHGATRLTVVPEGMLHLIPWSALPSLEGVDVVMAAGLSEVLAGRAEVPPVLPDTLVVANPTLDLHVSAAACRAAAASLPDGFRVTELREEAATEPKVVTALAEHGVLLFAGHGRADIGQSGMELHPHLALDQPGDPFPRWASAVSGWTEMTPQDDDPLWVERRADVPEVGRLVEREWVGTSRVDRRLEHPGGTVVGTYAGDRLLRLCELWSATDMMLADALETCRLAVLVACSSAAGVGRVEESPTVPISLQLAGVDTVVGTRWEVAEGYAALWILGFLELLGGQGGGRLDVPAAVRRTSERLSALGLAEAQALLLGLADRTDDPFAAMELEAYAHHLAGDAPFASLVHAQAFYVTGRPVLEFQAVNA